MLNKLKNPKFFIPVLLVVLFVGFILNARLNPKPVNVETEKAVQQQIIKTLTYSGEVAADNEVELSFLSAGKIVYFPKKEGDTVYQDELLASLDTTSNYYSYNQAVQTLQKAEWALEELNRKFIIDKSAFQDSEELYTTQKEQLEQEVQKAKLEVQKQSYNYTNYNIYSPINGTVISTSTELNKNINALSSVIKVADLNSTFLKVNIDAEDVNTIKVNQEVLVTLDNQPNKEITGTVMEISKVAKEDESGTKTVEVKITIPNNSTILGIEGSAKIVLERTNTKVLSIPAASLIEEDGDKFVYKVNKENKLQKIKIETGLEGDEYYELKKGNIKEGDLLVINPSAAIKENTFVKYE